MAGKTQHALSEYAAKIVQDWNAFCEANGFAPGQATHACRAAFMKSLSAEERAVFVALSMQQGWFAAKPQREATRGRSGSARKGTPPFKPFPR